MNKIKFSAALFFLFLIASLIINGCSAGQSIEQNSFAALQEKIQKRFNDSLFHNAHWGVLIKSLDDGKVWYKQNEEKMFMPASNEKIITASSTLITLGPNFNFETFLTTNGEIKDSILKGDVIVFGNGDPTFYNRFYADPDYVFNQWADTLLAKGIKTINGNIIGDDNAFDDEPIGYGWSLDGLDVWYSAEVGALQLNENYVDLKIIPPLYSSDSLKIIPNISSGYFKIINQTQVGDTGRSRISIIRPYGANNIFVKGYVAAGSHEFEYTPSITNPTLFYVTVLKEVFENKGISVLGNAIDCDDISNWNHNPEDFKTLLIHKSPPLIKILSGLLKRSQNMYAETMTRLLGWNEFGLGSFDNGKKVVEKVLQNEFNIQPNTYQYMDGSGLSRYDYVSPDQLIKILEGMTHNKYWDQWYDALPIAGIDGTLKNRMKGTLAEGNVHAKTGTISNVRGLSGYVTTADGEKLVFSFLVNGHLRSSKETEDITDSVLEMISSFKR